MIEVADNFLSPGQWKDLNKVFFDMGHQGITWGYSPTIVAYGEDKITSTGYFVHNFLLEGDKSDFYYAIEPLYHKIMELDYEHYPIVSRVKANLFPRTSTVEQHAYHYDMTAIVEETKEHIPLPHINAVYILNNSDGYTAFEDGSKIASVANRMIVFDGAIKHASTSCTNEQCRISINFNFIPEDSNA